MKQLKSFVNKHITPIAWSMVTAVVLIAIASHLQRTGGQVLGVSNYLLFPFFGILAFSLMWVHYVMGAVKKLCNVTNPIKGSYFKVTSWVVLFSFLLHPSLLSYQLYADGLGLPPQSYLENYIAPGLGWAAFLGTISLFTFLLFELRHKYGTASWWKYVLYANAAAMWAIYIHAIKLGSVLIYGWLQAIWVFYGVALAAALIVTYWPKKKA